MFFRPHPVTVEARDWDGSLPAGLDLVTWVKRNGGQAHLDTRGGKAVIHVWDTVAGQQTMVPQERSLVRDYQSGRFQLADRATITAEGFEEEQNKSGFSIFRSIPVTIEARDWDGTINAGLDLVTWVRTNGSHAHLDTVHNGPPSIVVGPPGMSDRMHPDLDLLCLDHGSRRFFVRERRQLADEYVEVESLDA